MSETSLNSEQLGSFGRDGYVVVPNVVPSHLLEEALLEVDRQVETDPPPLDHTGFHFCWCNEFTSTNPMLRCLTDSTAYQLAQSAILPKQLTLPDLIQIALNIPPWDHIPGGPHLDGLTPPAEDGRPGTFTFLAGIFLTDQSEENMGNVWVWPGSHRVNAEYFTDHGPEALLVHAPYPPTAHPLPPHPITGKAGDLFLAHYLLGHNIGGNLSDQTRKVLYFRLRTTDHQKNWKDCVTDPFFEFEPVREFER